LATSAHSVIRWVTDYVETCCFKPAPEGAVVIGGCSGRMMDFSRISAKLTPLLGQVVGERSLGRLPG
jgi:hypothetical protein